MPQSSNQHTGYREVIYIGPPPPKPKNSLGVWGFVLSTVGAVISFGLLSPLAALVSLFALYKKPRGFAVAGLIFGLAGTAFIGTIGSAMMHARQHHEMVRYERATYQQVQEAIQRIEDHRYEHTYLPDRVEGNKLVLDLTDMHGESLRYDLYQGKYRIRGAGPDNEWDTRDDITSQFMTGTAPGDELPGEELRVNFHE